MITLTTAVTSERLSERVEFTLDMLVVVAMRGVGVTVAVDLLSVDARGLIGVATSKLQASLVVSLWCGDDVHKTRANSLNPDTIEPAKVWIHRAVARNDAANVFGCRPIPTRSKSAFASCPTVVLTLAPSTPLDVDVPRHVCTCVHGLGEVEASWRSARGKHKQAMSCT